MAAVQHLPPTAEAEEVAKLLTDDVADHGLLDQIEAEMRPYIDATPQIIAIGPGEPAQYLHRDQWAYDHYEFPIDYEVQCNSSSAEDEASPSSAPMADDARTRRVRARLHRRRPRPHRGTAPRCMVAWLQ